MKDWFVLQRRKLLIFALLIVVVDLLAVWIYHRFAGNQIDPALYNAQQSNPAHAFVVFFHGPSLEHHGLDHITRSRIFEASVHSIKIRGVQNYVMLGGHWAANRHAPGAMHAYASNQPFQSGTLIADNWSYDTLTNLEAMAQLQARYQWQVLSLCSSPVHLLRIHYMLRKIKLEPLPRLQSVNCDSNYSSDSFSRIQTAHHEWIGLMLYTLLPDSFYRALMRWQRLG